MRLKISNVKIYCILKDTTWTLVENINQRNTNKVIIAYYYINNIIQISLEISYTPAS